MLKIMRILGEGLSLEIIVCLPRNCNTIKQRKTRMLFIILINKRNLRSFWAI